MSMVARSSSLLFLGFLLVVLCILPCTADSTINLHGGWNYISIPVTNPNYQYPISSLFSGVDTAGHSAFRYNAASQYWESLNLYSQVSPADGIWIYSSTPMTIPVQGDNSARPSAKQLVTGWNAIGYSGTLATSDIAFATLNNQWIMLMGWNATTQQFDPTIFNSEPYTPPQIIPGKGYWIYLTSPAGYSLPAITPVPTTIPTTQPTTAITTVPTTVIPTPSLDTNLTLWFIDVGQGDSILVRTPAGHTMLVDAGPTDKGPVVTNFMARNNVNSLDVALATHPHEDHIGGMAYVINHTPVSQYIESGYITTTPTYLNLLNTLNKRNIPYKQVKIGDTISLDPAVSIQVFNPQTTFFDNANDNSVVMKITYGTHTVLLPGDIDTQAENTLISKGVSLDADVLKVAHHGSDSSSSQAFISQVSPKYSIIEVGANNDYGHPSDTVLQRLLQAGSEIYRTDRDGNITVTFTNSLVIIGVEQKPIITPTPTPTPTTTITTIPTTVPTTVPTTISTNADLKISELNLQGDYVRIYNNGGNVVSLNGWTLHDQGPNYSFAFPSSLSILPGGTITLYSGVKGTNTTTEIYWNEHPVWNNDGDTAYLENPQGVMVSQLHRP